MDAAISYGVCAQSPRADYHARFDFLAQKPDETTDAAPSNDETEPASAAEEIYHAITFAIPKDSSQRGKIQASSSSSVRAFPPGKKALPMMTATRVYAPNRLIWRVMPYGFPSSGVARCGKGKKLCSGQSH